jgi:hypothetical protein
VCWHIYLEFVVAIVLATRWIALGLTLQGAGMPLLTLQTRHLPWHTALAPPNAWLLRLHAVSGAHPEGAGWAG